MRMDRCISDLLHSKKGSLVASVGVVAGEVANKGMNGAPCSVLFNLLTGDQYRQSLQPISLILALGKSFGNLFSW